MRNRNPSRRRRMARRAQQRAEAAEKQADTGTKHLEVPAHIAALADDVAAQNNGPG